MTRLMLPCLLQATGKEGYGFVTATGRQLRCKAVARVPLSASADASLRPAAALAASETPAEKAVLQLQSMIQGRASVVESLQHKGERLQHLEQLHAKLQSGSAGTYLLKCRLLYPHTHMRAGAGSGKDPRTLYCFHSHLSL